MIATLLRSPVAVVLGVLCGVVIGLSTDAISDAGTRAYDWVRPVASGSATRRSIDGTAVELDLTVTRHRGECVVQQLVAVGRTPEGGQQLMQMQRVDESFGKRNIPEGETANIGTWRVWPIPGVARLAVYGHYLCGERRVSALLAEVTM